MSQDPLNDRLNHLWRSEASSSSSSQKEKEGEAMLTMVIERTRKFDRQILMRNAREYVAAFLATAIFAWFAWKVPTGLEKIGYAIVAASGAWIGYYLFRFGSGPKALDPGVSLNAYNQLLRESYERQIRLARNAKYWYLLPMYAGLLVANLGFWLRMHNEGKNPWSAAVSLLIVTAGFVGVWILNEVYAVRYLEKMKRELDGMK